jgi:hypothetical protein
MALKDPRRIPEEKAATHEELTAAIEGLTRSELVKLYKSAAYKRQFWPFSSLTAGNGKRGKWILYAP